MTNRIHVIFDEPEDARRAMRALLAAGVKQSDVTLMSSEPHLEASELMAESGGTLIPYFTLGGGMLGAMAGFCLVYFTSHSYPVATGGMPLVPPFTTGIIMYETAAMGAIFCALGRLLWEARLPRFSAARDDYATELADGGVLVSVRAADEAEQWRDLLINAGGREPTSK
jgi:hypothetical protein